MRKHLIIFLGIALLGVSAAALVFPQQTNQLVARGQALLGNKISMPSVSALPFRLGLDLQGGVHLVYEADLSGIPFSEQGQAMDGLRDVIERRVNLFGISEPVVQVQDVGASKRLVVELAGVTDPNTAIQLIGQTPYLEFRIPKENYQDIVAKGQKMLEEGGGGTIEEPFAPSELTGRFLDHAELGFDGVTQAPVIDLSFNKEGATIFEQITKEYTGRPIAIYLDGQFLQAPVVRGTITGGKAQIVGQFTLEEVKQTVRELNAGALPVPITLLSQKSVGATLGQASLTQSLQAGFIGLLLVAAFMIVWYRLPGVISVGALLIYILVLLAIFKLLGVTFSLAGIAGIILSLGMAVDANVLIFSRMREELKIRRDLVSSIEEGFRRAWPSIRDGNITTLLVSLILFWFGTSFVQGFALTLSIGILLSMFSAVIVTREIMLLLAKTVLRKPRVIWK